MYLGDNQLEPMDEHDLRALGPRAFKTVAPKPKLLTESEALPGAMSVAGVQARINQAGAATVRQTKGLLGDVAHDTRAAIEETKAAAAEDTQQPAGAATFDNPLDTFEVEDEQTTSRDSVDVEDESEVDIFGDPEPAAGEEEEAAAASAAGDEEDPKEVKQ